jgi:hypothetical protein
MADPLGTAAKPRHHWPPVVATQSATTRKENNMPTVTAKSLKCTFTLDPAEVVAIAAPESGPNRTVLTVRFPDRAVSVDLSAKSVRRAQAAIREHGTDGVAVLIQGKLVANPDRIVEGGLAAQVKAKAATPAAAA